MWRQHQHHRADCQHGPGALYRVGFLLTANGVLSGETIDVQFGSTIGYSAFQPPIPMAPTYAAFSFDAHAASAATLFAFDGTGVSGTMWIDNVSVVQLSEPIPEPGTLAALAGSLLGLTAVRRRRRG